MDKVTVVTILNPFKPQDRVIKTVDHSHIITLAGYVNGVIAGENGTFAASVNGHVIPQKEWDKTSVAPGAYIAIVPVLEGGGDDKNPFALIAGIALMAWTGGLAKGGFWGMTGGKFAAQLVATAIAMVGGMLINRLFPPPKPELPEYSTANPSYTWGRLQSLQTQGNALGVTYGTTKSAGQILAQHVTSDGDKEYLNLLLLAGEGELDTITTIMINDNPVVNYDNVVVDIRLGTNDQAVIPNFRDTYADQQLGFELTNDWSAQQTESGSTEGLEIVVELPGGLYYANDSGGLSSAWVDVTAEYRPVGGTWISFGSWRIEAAQNNALRRVYRKDNIPAGKYEVRLQCTAKSGTSSRHATRIYWTTLSSIIYDDFAHPGKALIGIKALATDQISGGVPSVTWMQTRSTVWAYNPDTGIYEAKPANNPAWVCYDIIHRARKLKDTQTNKDEIKVFGIPAARLNYGRFKSWADFCTEKQLTFNFIFDTAADMWAAMKKPETIGRGRIILQGTTYSCVFDAPAQPVQMFTMGNIVADSFKEHFLSLKDRSNAVEITYVDKDRDYQRTPISVYGDDYNETQGIINSTQITLEGCTSIEQAHKHGKYLLRVNQYLQRTAEWEADVDAIACQVGDVVLLAHDVPQWGYSGRIAAATANTVTLDKPVTLLPGKTYGVLVRMTDDTIIERTVQAIAEETETNTLTVTTSFSPIPARWDIYSFGELTKIAKPFSVIDITRSQDMRRKITGIEYVEAVYTEATNVPEINYSSLESDAEVISITVNQETYRQKDGTVISNLYPSWKTSRGKTPKYYVVSYRKSGTTAWMKLPDTLEQKTVIGNVKALESYEVKVQAINDVGVVSTGRVSSAIYITGKDAPPSNVPGFAAAIDLSDSTKVKLSWSAVTDIDLAGYQIAEGSSIIELCWTGTNYTYTATASRQHNFSVKAVDNSGNQSAVPATKSITVTIEPTKVAGFNYAIQETDRSRVLFSWTANGEKDLSYYELREGQLWETATVIAPQLKATSYQHVLTTEGSKTYLVKAFNVAGNESTEASSVTMQVILRPDTPTNLQVQQEPKDRSLLKLSWTASFGKDIAGYEIRKGTVWDTGEIIAFAKDTAYWYSIPSSGTYEFMIRAKTVVGQLSNIANVSATVMIEAYDVTGFTAIQMIADRTKVRLSWDASLSLDISHHEIRKGSTWDTAAIIDKQATGTFYDVIVTDETPQTFWIKAVSVAGKYSQNAAKVEDIFNMNPSPVTNIQLSQDVNDKSILIITWTGISESDLVAYEIRVGYTWETSEKIGETKEQHWSYRPTQTGNIKVIIKSKNAARYYSDEASANYYATLEPLAVTGFQVLQNGEYVEFFWNKSDEPDVIAYEIREGTSFELGILVDSGITLNSHKAKVDQEREYRYHIKAINRSNRYSQSSASQSVIVSNLPPKNIILSYDEIARADGTHSNTEFGASLINFSNIGSRWSDYLTTRFSDVGGQVVLKLAKEVKDGFYVSPFLSEMGTYYQSGIYTCETIDVGQVITANITNRFTSTVNLKNAGLAKIQIRTSRDGEKWTEWQDFRPAEYTFRYLGRRALLATDDITKTPEINQFVTMIDVDDFEQTGTVTVPVGGGTFLYPKQYYTVPILTPTAFGDNRFFHVTEKTKTGFSGYVADRAGNDVGGQLDYRTRGY